MGSMKKKLLSLILTATVVLGMAAAPVAASDSSDKVITLFHTNDIHGAVEESDDCIGMSKVVSMVKATENALLLDAGDATQGTTLAALSDGQTILEIMKEAGYTAAAVGNHEFDYGQEQLEENMDYSEVGENGFPLLAANVSSDDPDSQLNDLTDGYIITEVDGVKIGIFGILTPTTSVTASPEYVKGVNFGDVAETSARVAAALKEEGADIVVCLSHCGYEDSDVSSKAIAESSDDIDVILDGHAHQTGTWEENGTIITSTGTALVNLGKVEITVGSDNQVTDVNAEILSKSDFDNIEADAGMDATIEELSASLEEIKTTIVGKTATGLYGGTVTNGGTTSESVARRVETNLGSLVADARKWAAEEALASTEYADLPVVVLQGGGSIRASIPAGDITLNDVYTVLPFFNDEAYVLITPAKLYEVVQNGISAITEQDSATGQISANGSIHGRFLQPSGYTYSYRIVPGDLNEDGENLNNEVVEIVLDDGTVLDPDDTTTQLVLVTCTYEMTGGDGFSCIMDNEVIATSFSSDISLVKYLEYLDTENNPLEIPFNTDRITIVDSVYTGTSFDVDISVEGAAGTEFTYYINGVETGTVAADADGVVTLTLENGAQEVYLESGEAESSVMYFDNYTGLTDAVVSMDFTQASADNSEDSASQDTEAADKTTQAAKTADEAPAIWIAALAVSGMAILIQTERKRKYRNS